MIRPLLPHEQRVVAEHDQLRERLSSLRTSIAAGSFYRVERAERRRLIRQKALMTELEQVLAERITAFTSPDRSPKGEVGDTQDGGSTMSASKSLKPQLADDVDFATLPYPVWGMPKIDGVRGLQPQDKLVGRSLDEFKGFGVTDLLSHPEHAGFDGEITLGFSPVALPGESLCAQTTGAVGAFKGVTEPADLHWWLFDLVTPETVGMEYAGRYANLRERVSKSPFSRLRLVPYEVIFNADEAKAFAAKCLADGFEGAVFRNPRAAVKEGRPTKAGQQFMRFKPWADFEILVTAVVEEETNTNEAKKNTLGKTERSSAKAGKVKNGKVGAVVGTVIKDVTCPFTGRVLFPAGMTITAGAGRMKDAEAKAFFEDQTTVVGRIAKIKHLAYGVMDQPRMATFECLRDPVDMGEPA